jgi:hypothetical protein
MIFFALIAAMLVAGTFGWTWTAIFCVWGAAVTLTVGGLRATSDETKPTP